MFMFLLFAGVGVSLLTAGFCGKGKYRVNIVHITTMKTMNPELFYLYRLHRFLRVGAMLII